MNDGVASGDRAGALDLIVSVLSGATWDNAMRDSRVYRDLEGRDRAFAARLAAGTLRHYNVIKSMLKSLSGRPQIKPLSLEALCAMGVAQILFLEVPDYAAVNASVALAQEPQKGFVNAILRSAARQKESLLAPGNFGMQAVPAWLYRDWLRDYGPLIANQIAAFCLLEPDLDLTLKNPSEAQSFANVLGGMIHPFGGLRIADLSAAITDLPGYADGAWWVQDAAAAYPLRMMADKYPDWSGKRALDLCAAPGGKTLQMAAMGADVVALDISAARLDRVRENAVRCGLADRITCIECDARDYQDAQPFDLILCDAPCTATGTLRRHADMWVQKKPRPIENYLRLQRDLLDKSVTLLEPTGLLLYVTCSLDKREGEAQAEAFIERHPEFKLAGSSQKNRILPHEAATDGFFFCAFAQK